MEEKQNEKGREESHKDKDKWPTTNKNEDGFSYVVCKILLEAIPKEKF